MIKPGDKFTRLTVVSKAPSDKHGNPVWNVLCDCGTEKSVRQFALTGKYPTFSCGCLAADALRAAPPRVTHGMSDTPTYKSWCNMTKRVLNPKYPFYRDYGGRGITICERWRSFENFYEDMGPRLEGMTLDRADNEGNYEPGNCRWATMKQQANNTRRTKRKLPC